MGTKVMTPVEMPHFTRDEPAFPKLFSPFQSGRLDLKSRLVMLPHGTAMVRQGIPTDEDLTYYAARAKGLGLVITGATVAHSGGTFRVRHLTEAFNPEVIPALQRRTAMVKSYGARIVGQLCHLGRETVGAESEYPPVGASVLRSPRDPYPPHELEGHEIAEIIEGFALSSANLKTAGYDGVELHAAHGYLFAQFLSPATNTRTDAWGGTPEKRLRLLVETIERIRETCGPAFIIGVRLSADEETADGLGVRDSVAIAQALARQAETDYLNITVGMRGSYVKDITAPEAPAARAAAIIRRESALPIILGQKIQTPELAERLLADDVADLIGMARAFIADPQFAVKAQAGQSARIRPCVGLNQDCRSFTPHLHCAINPETGRELREDFGPLQRVDRPRRVAVIGGGPGGMEAARIAALRGHAVTLFEASDALGGQFLLAASLPHRSGLLRIIDHLIGELRYHDVQVEMNTRVDDLNALRASFDAAVIATGAVPAPLSSWSSRGVSTLAWSDVLQQGAPEVTGSGHAVFVDDGLGFWFSYGVAEMLTVAGWRVTFLTSSAAVGGNLPAESVPSMLGRLGLAQTTFRVLTGVEQVDDQGVQVVNLTSGQEEHIACDLVVIQTGRLVKVPAIGAQKAQWPDLHRIGDCVTPRRISHALFEAQRAARSI